MTKVKAENVHTFPLADAETRTRHVFVRDLVLPCRIGVHGHERGKRQRVRINLDLGVAEGAGPVKDNLAEVVCYETVVAGVREIVGQGHVNLVETLAERVAEACLSDPRVGRARVRVEKLDVLPDAVSVGVEIERVRRRF
ncbi:MAG: dihydroneopterin aldolase [Proteobacteria bacterium]|nr:dihydroneopterin aldolase [Pseudomonadota bacterium]